MSYTVGLQISRLSQIPSPGANRNFGAQQASGFGAAPTGTDLCCPCGREQAIQSRGTDLTDELAVPAAQALEPALIVGQPLLQDGHQAFAARLFSLQPNVLHHRLNLLIPPLWPGMNLPGGRRQATAQEFDRVFPLISIV